jgi:hypothetical protein
VALTTGERAEVNAELQRRFSVDTLPCGITKADLRAAVDAVDDWVEANQTAFNLAIPQPARGALSATQKALLLDYVVRKRIADLPSS